MKYQSVKQTAQKWGISPTMVRRYCLQGRIPKAVLGETGWKIPENARKPGNENQTANTCLELRPLAKKLVRQKKKKSFHGLYDYVQINLTYSSCRMASNRLTRKQVEQLFRKGKVADMFEPIKASDVIEAMNHCSCIDYVLDHLAEPLSVRFIKKLHELLMKGSVDATMMRVVPGEFRTVQTIRREKFFLPAEQISKALQALLAEYEKTRSHSLDEILEFHVHFERIFPFEDGNGRIGRLILFKECLRHGLMPFILDDKRRGRYLDGIRHWDEESQILQTVVEEAQARFAAQETLQDHMEQERRLAPAYHHTFKCNYRVSENHRFYPYIWPYIRP